MGGWGELKPLSALPISVRTACMLRPTISDWPLLKRGCVAFFNSAMCVGAGLSPSTHLTGDDGPLPGHTGRTTEPGTDPQ